MFRWGRNLEVSIFRSCLKNYEKGDSGQFSPISKEHRPHPEELEDDFLSNSLPKPLSDFLRSENYSSGSHKRHDHYLTDSSEPLEKLLESGKCTAWRWSGSKYNSFHFWTPLESGQQDFRHAPELCPHVLIQPGRSKFSLPSLTMFIGSPESFYRSQELTWSWV